MNNRGSRGNGGGRYLLLGLSLFPLLFAGCGHIDERGEAWQQYYGSANAGETETRLVERKRIQCWTKDLKSHKEIGYLEKCTLRLKGARDWHDLSYILNAAGTTKIGFINERGVFFRYDGKGSVRVGEYTLLNGLKVLFGLPMDAQIILADIDISRGGD